MNFKRILAGLLTIFTIVTQVPQVSMTAMAAENLLVDEQLNNENAGNPGDDDHEHEHELGYEHDYEHEHAEDETGGGDQGGNLGEDANCSGDDSDNVNRSEDQQPVEQLNQDNENENNAGEFKPSGTISFTEKEYKFESKASGYEAEESDTKERRLYDALKKELDKILDGEKDPDAKNEVYTSELLGGELIYTYEDLEIAVNGDAEDPVTDEDALRGVLEETLSADLQAVSAALFSEMEGSINWIPAENGVKFTRDYEKVYIEDAVIWTVVFELETVSEQDITEDDAKDIQEGLEVTEESLEDPEEDKVTDLKTDETLKIGDELKPDEDQKTDEADNPDAEKEVEIEDDLILDTRLFSTQSLNADGLLEESKLTTTDSALNTFSTFATNEDEEDEVLPEDTDAFDDISLQGFSKSLWLTGVNESYPYMGIPVTLRDYRVYFGKKLLTEGTDYTVSYKNNSKIGLAQLTVTGKGNYTGTVSKSFEIKDEGYTGNANAVAFTARNLAFENFLASLDYTGTPQKQETVLVYCGDERLKEGTDYVVSFSKDPVNVGSYTATYTGIGAYKGSIKKSFKINAVDINSEQVQITIAHDALYRKGGAKAEAEVIFYGRRLEENVDYTLSYKNNTKVGAAGKVTIKGKGNFKGAFEQSFTVGPNNDSASIVINAADKAFANKAGNYTTSLALTDNDGKKLVAGTDYDRNIVYEYMNDTLLPGGAVRYAGDQAGTGDIVPADTLMRVVVTLRGNYSGTREATYRVTGQDLSKATVKVANQIYTGKEIRPDASQITVTLGKTVLSAADYEIISYNNNINKGTGKLTIRGIGQYGGTRVATFAIAARTTSYSIVFYGNGATGGTMANQLVAPGKVANLTANKYTRTNYLFDGWTTNPDGTGDRYKNLAEIRCNAQLGNSGEVLYLYANWAPDPKKVKNFYIKYINVDGGLNNPLNDKTSYTTIDPDITIYAPAKELWPTGYQFGGWYKESTFKTRVSVIKSGSSGNVNLYAKWIPYSYTVKFDGNGATEGTMPDEAFSYGVYKKLNKNTFKKSGSVFLGWSLERSASVADYTDSAMVKDIVAARNSSAEAVTLYAVWDDYFDISYELGAENASLVEGYVSGYRYGDRAVNLINEAKAVRPGYDFAGWYKDAAFKTRFTSISKTSTGDITVYAKWTPWTYRIQYVGGQGSAGKSAVQTVKTDSATMAVCGYTYPGKKFAGWSKTENATEADFYTGELVGRDRLMAADKNGTVRLYAVWTDVTRASGNERTFYNVIFDPNTVDIDGNPIKVSGKTAGLKINVGEYKTLTRNSYSVKGWKFLEWNTLKDGTGIAYADMAQVKDISFDKNGKAKLYAIWEKQGYTITYHNIIGDVPSTVSTSYTVDDTASRAIALYTPAAIGQTFAGWYSDAALKKKVTNIAKGSTGDKDFYAKWTSNYYTISYNLNDSNANSDGKIVRAILDTTNAGYTRTFDSSYDQGYVLATAKREGYRFVGWYQDKAGKKPVTFITGAPSVDMTVYAKWAEEPREVNEDGSEEILHVWTENKVSVSATCTEDGIEGSVCRYCGAPAPEAVIPATGHTTATRIADEATYKKEGVSEEYCVICGEVLETRAIPMLPCTHPANYSEQELISEATCTEYAVYKVTCTRCGQVTNSSYIDTEGGFKEHDYELISLTPSTCTEKGSKKYICKTCNSTKTTSIAKTSHDWSGQYVITKQPTCTETGTKELFCKKCEQSIKTLEIAKLAHAYSWVTTREATDTEDGLKEYKCSVCGDINKAEVIPRTGTGCAHPVEYSLYELISPATCIDKAHYTLKCSLCGEVLSEDYQKPDGQYNPDNHVNLTIKTKIAPTTEETGIRTYYCSSCGYTKEEVIPVKTCSHWNKEVKNIDGKLYWKCSECGELAGEASPDDCIHGYYGYDYVQRVVADENTWGETDLVCKNCKTVKQTFKIHPYSEYHVTDQSGQDVTLYGWFDDDAAREVFNLTNEYRQENGLNKLTYNTTCQDASNLRSLETLVYWGHTRPNGTKWNTIISQWKYGGENLAQNQRTPSAVMTAWKNSPGHNANLLYGINSGETPFKGLSVSCFHQLIIDEDYHYVSLEKISWTQNFTFYEY